MKSVFSNCFGISNANMFTHRVTPDDTAQLGVNAGEYGYLRSISPPMVGV
jgi:hypothetical protein